MVPLHLYIFLPCVRTHLETKVVLVILKQQITSNTVSHGVKIQHTSHVFLIDPQSCFQHTVCHSCDWLLRTESV